LDNDARIANARRDTAVPTLEQIAHVLASMPTATDTEKRNRALIAFTILTGARDGAMASLKLKHVDLAQAKVFQDARQVATKRRKSFTTWFFAVGDEPLRIVSEWIEYLRGTLLWGEADALFPKTKVAIGAGRTFEAAGLERECWSTAQPIREIFREAFRRAGLSYFNPHSFRNTLAQLGERVCKTPEEFKAWSQNLGHERTLTTFTSYGSVAPTRQAEIMRQIGAPGVAAEEPEEILSRIAALALRKSG
jgi:integrase